MLPSGERHHLTILISTLRHIVIFGWIKNGPKLGANLTEAVASYESLRPPFISIYVRANKSISCVGKFRYLTGAPFRYAKWSRAFQP